jgi:anti-sigma factor RsiW
MMRRHLTDAQLIEASIGHTEHDAFGVDHIEHCGECQARHESLRALLTETAEAATAESDAAFPAERLLRQHERIMAGVEQLSRVGRVISFPSAFRRVAPQAGAHGSRWVAAAAAAGLVVGLLGGHLTHDLRVQPATLANRAPATPTRAVIVPASQGPEDDLLGQVEVAFEGRTPSALRPLDALTPVAWDVRE